MSPPDQHDLVVIGGGTAGLVTAAGAAALGARVVLVERDRLGGECLWTGCVPSKALIGSARAAQTFRDAGRFGLEARPPEIDGRAVLRSVRRVRDRVQHHDDPDRFREMGVEVLEGSEARFLSARSLEVDGLRLTGRKLVIATGSRPAVPPVDGLDEAGYTTHETAFEEEELPRSALVLGGGPIGVELAQAYRRLGVEVTLVEMEDRLLVREDRELADRLGRRLEAEGVRVLTGWKAVEAARATGGGDGHPDPGRAGGDDGIAAGRGEGKRAGERAHRRLTVRKDGETRTLRAEMLMVATGRRPNVETLNLDAAGVETASDGIVVDEKLRTSRAHIFACGDVIGGYLFTHVADHEARTVVRNALFPFPRAVDYSVVPWTIYTEPELARVGLTEEQARERFRSAGRAAGEVAVHRYDLEELDRAITDRAAHGLVKLVSGPDGRILGAHILAPDAGTMIVEVALAMRRGVPVTTLSDLIHPYPTMSEGVRRAAGEAQRARLTPTARRWLDRWLGVWRTLV